MNLSKVNEGHAAGEGLKVLLKSSGGSRGKEDAGDAGARGCGDGDANRKLCGEAVWGSCVGSLGALWGCWDAKEGPWALVAALSSAVVIVRGRTLRMPGEDAGGGGIRSLTLALRENPTATHTNTTGD